MPDPPHRSSAEPGPAPPNELFGGSTDPAATGPMREVPSTATFPSPAAAARLPTRPRWWAGQGAVVAVVLVVLALAGTGLWAASGPERTPGRAIPGNQAATVPGADLAERASRTDTDCAAHSYGRVRNFLTAHPCTSLRRALFTGASSGRPVVVAVSTVSMATQQDAAALRQLTDTDGTGNVSDLLREGVTLPGGPSRLHHASYASQRRDSTLVIVEAATVSGAAEPLRPLAEAALRLGG
ncbi:MAG: hypothetical protein ACRDSP_03265 [Pseudonocardiaceae bacterium]